MGINAWVSGFVAKGYHTETASTDIDETIDGSDGKRLVLTSIDYLAGATAHIISFMHCGGASGQRTNANADAAITQKELVCDAAPTDGGDNVAESADIIAYQVEGGGWEWNTIASLATNTITLTTNIAIKVLEGAPIRVFGIAADNVSFQLGLAANVTTRFVGDIIIANPFKGDPFYVSVDNTTNDGFLNNLLFAYINK